MRKGVVVDLEETIKSIEAATKKPNVWPGYIGDVYVGITGDHIRCTNNRAVVATSVKIAKCRTSRRRMIDASKILIFRRIDKSFTRFHVISPLMGKTASTIRLVWQAVV